MVLLHLQMRLHDGVADALLGQAQTLADTGKQDEAEQVTLQQWPAQPQLMQHPLCPGRRARTSMLQSCA